MTCKQCGVSMDTLKSDGRCSLCHATDPKREYKIGDKVILGENIGHINAIRITQGNSITYECGYFNDKEYTTVELYDFEIEPYKVNNSEEE